MPKIIENLKICLMEEARRQTKQEGYGSVTIRSVATACGVGVGTVYNYFSSKDALLAAFMLEDWQLCMKNIEDCAQRTGNRDDVLRCMYEQLSDYLQMHSIIFQDVEAAAHYGKSMSTYHGLLRQQLAKPLRVFCSDGFTAEFVAEALLTWTIQQVPFELLLPVLQKVF